MCVLPLSLFYAARSGIQHRFRLPLPAMPSSLPNTFRYRCLDRLNRGRLCARQRSMPRFAQAAWQLHTSACVLPSTSALRVKCHLPHILSSQCLRRGHPTNTALRSQSHSAASASPRRQSPFWQSRSPPLARLTQRRVSSRTWLLMWKADRWSLLTQRFRRSQTLPEFGSCTSFQSCNRRAARKRSRPRSSRKKRRS